MRSRTNRNIPITNGQVHSWALEWLTKAKLLKDHGYDWDSSGKLMYPAGKTETLAK